MRISDIMRLGKSAIIFATIVVGFFGNNLALGYKMIYKKILHGKKQISIGRIGLVCVLAVYICCCTLCDIAKRRYWFWGIEYRANFKPFSSYKEAWYNFSAQEWRNLILNICMFVRLDFYYQFVLERLKERGKYICAGLGLHCL